MKDTEKLWTAYHQDRGVSERNQIVCEYLHLAKSHAHRISKNLASRVDIDEIEGAAYLGLIFAVERYNPARKIKFETFSYPRIHGSVMDWLRLQDSQARTVRKFERAKRNVVHLLSMDGPVSEAKIAERLNLTPERYGLLNNTSHRGRQIHLSLLETDETKRAHTIQDKNVEDPSGSIDTKMFVEFILTGLPHLERTVIRYYYFGGLTLRQIGKKLDLSESRASQLKTRAYDLIRTRFQSRDLTPEYVC